jgi:hypothetical protein
MSQIKLPRRAKMLIAFAAAAIISVVAVFAANATTALARSQIRSQTSENWAGYAVTGKRFSTVSASWTEPAVKASSGSSDSYSAVWVGLGGYKSSSSSLEQIGTAADYTGGHAHYYAWYELYPSREVRLNIAIHPGDKISARVSVAGATVTVSLSDNTTGQSTAKTLHMSDPNISSAEWIVEAPATETFGSNTQILALADFGRVSISSARATAAGHMGGISDSHWTATRIQMRSQGSLGSTTGPGFVSLGPGAQQSDAGASTSTLSNDSFSVSWQASSQTTSSGQPAAGQFPAPGASSPVGGSGYGPAPALAGLGANSGP